MMKGQILKGSKLLPERMGWVENSDQTKLHILTVVSELRTYLGLQYCTIIYIFSGIHLPFIYPIQ